ncbi:YhcN/YlaJ family sporulation lipoprotein [Virgibacillus xinjiangensis]|uniref:YhcN/YlaJ family sporulation lipoprotein n=1 Tax=Virgibacillus xinjiangensis TaxID=393090 RepID=A0ABV7CY08_9BACI
MKKQLLFISILTLVFLGACAPENNDPGTDEQEEIADELDPNTQMEENADPEMDERLGYVHYQRDEIENNEEANRDMEINRPQMADMITRTILQSEGFEQAATLVTDEEVLIAYEKNEKLNDDEAANTAAKTAESVMPGYFKIHVSDNIGLIDEIQSLHNSTTQNQNFDNTINQIIQEMEKPQ